MIIKKSLITLYKFLSSIYVFIFGRKTGQVINDLIFSLSIDAKGYKNYGSHSKTGEKNFIKLIKEDISFALDIGANVGNYTKLLLSETSCVVNSFEPLPEAFKELENIKFEYPNRLYVHNFAVGNENTTQNLYFGDIKSEKASLMPNLEKLSFVKDGNNKNINVKVKKLDDCENLFKDNRIDFIKIDTEGYEYEVLLGAKNILMKHKPKFIQMEFNWHQLLKNQTLYNLSKFMNFSEVFRILPYGKKLIQIDPSRPENNIYHLSNYVFIRKDISKKFK